MAKSANLLIVDDEQNIRRVLQAAFEKQGYAVHTAEGGAAALRILEEKPIDLMVSDVMMPDIQGTELLKQIRTAYPELVVIMMTAFGTIPQAVGAIQDGAFDYLTKPFDLERMRKIVARGLQSRNGVAEPASGGRSRTALSRRGSATIVGSAPAMKDALALIDRVADAKATVLITGESGTGKELVARALHDRSSRSAKPFIAVNCAALPETLLESELFGYEKGAFTGASGSKPGRFELAAGGTLFLDEIGEVPLAIQVKLLRVLQEREFERLGATKPTKVDVRLVTATNRDLQEAVSAGQFRADFYYRLQVVQIPLPPLRERVEDISALAEHFIAKYNAENGRHLKGLSAESMEALTRYRWPGNIRELENTIERAVVLAGDTDELITPDLLPPHIGL